MQPEVGHCETTPLVNGQGRRIAGKGIEHQPYHVSRTADRNVARAMTTTAC
jgi:hypothetical protein